VTDTPPGANRKLRAFPTPIEVLAVDSAADRASVIVVGWHLTRPVEIPLGPIVAATGIVAHDLPGRWLEAAVNCYAERASDLVFRDLALSPDDGACDTCLNADDARAYPWICPGHDEPVAEPDEPVRQLLVHPAVWPALVQWLADRHIGVNPHRFADDDLPTYVMTPEDL